MSTPKLLRVKRRITEDPSDVLVLSASKRRKADSDDGGMWNCGLKGLLFEKNSKLIVVSIALLLTIARKIEGRCLISINKPMKNKCKIILHTSRQRQTNLHYFVCVLIYSNKRWTLLNSNHVITPIAPPWPNNRNWNSVCYYKSSKF